MRSRVIARHLLLPLAILSLASCKKAGPDLSRVVDEGSGVVSTSTLAHPPARDSEPTWHRDSTGLVTAYVRVHSDCPDQVWNSIAGARAKEGRIELCYKLLSFPDKDHGVFYGACPQDLTVQFVLSGVPEDANPTFTLVSCSPG